MEISNLRKSTWRNKKYMVDVTYNNIFYKNQHFGDIRYGQYRDSTGIKLYSHLDNNDPERKRFYHARHKNNTGISAMLSKEFLW